MPRTERRSGSCSSSWAVWADKPGRQPCNTDCSTPPRRSRRKTATLLVLTGSKSNELLEHWAKNLALVFRKAGRDFRELERAPNAMSGTQPRRSDDGAAPRVVIRADGSLAALLSFESPVSRGRTVVALVGSDAAAAESLVASLEDESKVPQIRGELALVRNDAIQSYQGGDLYYVGSLSWWQWLWFISRGTRCC